MEEQRCDDALDSCKESLITEENDETLNLVEPNKIGEPNNLHNENEILNNLSNLNNLNNLSTLNNSSKRILIFRNQQNNRSL